MKQYTIVNDNDGNETFTVEAEDENEAMEKALEELGWFVSESEETDEEDEEEIVEEKDRKNGLYGAEYDGENF